MNADRADRTPTQQLISIFEKERRRCLLNGAEPKMLWRWNYEKNTKMSCSYPCLVLRNDYYGLVSNWVCAS